jgi:hypothetical protein
LLYLDMTWVRTAAVTRPGSAALTGSYKGKRSGASAIRFTADELTELNTAVRGLEVRGQRLPDAVLAFSGVEAPPRN